MAYTTPVFNLTADVWNDGNTPDDGPADWTGVACQFYIYSRHSTPIQPCELELYTPVIQVRLPIAAAGPWVAGQIFEVVGASGRFYRARFKERVHYGFVNEYLVVIVVQCNSAGVPLIRDIENAEPCNPGIDGESAAELTVEIEMAGEGDVSAVGPGIVGSTEYNLVVETEGIGNSGNVS